MKACSPDLLEHLANLTGCTYLSDLRFAPPSPEALHLALLATPASAFPGRQWQEALCYLTGAPSTQLDGPACRDQLLRLCCGRTNSSGKTSAFP